MTTSRGAAPSISVVVPAYNAERFIGETLSSILAQSLPAQEVVVVDDGSKDGTAALIEREFPSVRLVRSENRGCGAARGHAIAHSSGEWLAPCDADDVWEKDHLQRKVDLLARFPDVDIAFSNCYAFGEKAEAGHQLFAEAPPDWFERFRGESQDAYFRLKQPYLALLYFHPAYQSGLMFRRSVYDRMGGFLPKYSRWVGEDSEFIRRFLADDRVHMAGDEKATWGYRRHGSNMSGTRWKNYYCKPLILQEHQSLGHVPQAHQAAVKQEVDRSLTEAFDVASWDGACDGVLQVYAQLPASARTWRRRAKALRCRLRRLWP
jgi:glycosyltransferase involved in cell wall biosynthesis